MSDLKKRYEDEMKPALQKALAFDNPMQVPCLKKVVVNVGVKAGEKEVLDAVVADLSRITGQVPQVRRAKKSISNFKVRAGMPVGARVTLRGKRMYDFIERLVHVALPRIRDFRGLPSNVFDGKGNYNFGVDDQTIFPEIDPDETKYVHGMNITLVTSAIDDASARELLKALGMPLSDESKE
jgi:large subunit ribosomal protein L5